jgi:hypothetical protein
LKRISLSSLVARLTFILDFVNEIITLTNEQGEDVECKVHTISQRVLKKLRWQVERAEPA